MYSVVYHHHVVAKDIPKLSSREKQKIQTAIQQRLTTQPDLYGKPLRRSLRGYRKLRVGDYRVVFRVDKRVVKVLVIQHRSSVYDMANRRA